MANVKIDLQNATISTTRDSYLLDGITVVSVRRPFLLGGLLSSAGLVGFATSFHDLLYDHEIHLLLAAVATLIVLAFQIGRLKLLSRDLRGSELSDVIWGRYASLNRTRLKIASAVNQHKGARR